MRSGCVTLQAKCQYYPAASSSSKIV